MDGDQDWTENELRATVEAYLEMLQLEINGKRYSKAEVGRRLRATSLTSRTEGALEFRMQNISAVLVQMKRPRIAGYRPALNVGPKNEDRIRRLIEAAQPLASRNAIRFRDVIPDASSVMGVKAVFGPISSHVLCFGARGDEGSKSYFSIAAGTARKASKQPYIITIGGGKNVRDGLQGKVLNITRVSSVYGPTKALLSDPFEIARLAQWPVAIALHDVWEFVDTPHIVDDLEFPDRTILAGAQDGIVRPQPALDLLWKVLQNRLLVLASLPLPGNFFDSGRPTLVQRKLPLIPASLGSEEGERVWKLQLRIERDPSISVEAKRLNALKNGAVMCEACGFVHSDPAMFDAHHPTPLAVGKRVTLPQHLQILCPTCHRRAHRKSRNDPFQLRELKEWIELGRP